jgi:dTDP-6-deoxy-L-talose 4-dehydrogenase (NAD+)
MKKVAVTGATGFVGRHLLRNLLDRGIQVVAAARSATSQLMATPNLEVADIDISEGVKAAERLGAPDVLIHLAWSGLPNYQSDSHLKIELPKQLAFMHACREQGVKRIVVTGTCLEYGMHLGELNEDEMALPTTSYGQAKHALHEALEEMHAQGDLSVLWLRLFYLYGDGQAPTSLYSQLRSAIASGARSIPMSPGDQLRDFLPIEAAVDKIAALALNMKAEGTVNVCSGKPIAVASFADAMIRKARAGLALDLGAFSYPEYEPFSFWGNVEKLDRLTGNS